MCVFPPSLGTSRARWPSPIPYYNSQKSSVRDAYLARHTALEQLKFEDPVIDNFLFNLKSHDHLLFLDNRIILSEVPKLQDSCLFLLSIFAKLRWHLEGAYDLPIFSFPELL